MTVSCSESLVITLGSGHQVHDEVYHRESRKIYTVALPVTNMQYCRVNTAGLYTSRLFLPSHRHHYSFCPVPKLTGVCLILYQINAEWSGKNKPTNGRLD
jgi:hypothetical protein